MRTRNRFVVIHNMANIEVSVKNMISIIIWVVACLEVFCNADSDAESNARRRSSFSTSSEYINPYKSRGASLRGRHLSGNFNALRDAAPFPFRYLPNPVILRRPVSDSFFYDPQVSPSPVHLRRQRQQFQNTDIEHTPKHVKTPNEKPKVQIKELPPRNLAPKPFQTKPRQPFSRRTHPLLTASIQDATLVRLQEISELPQTSPFPPPPPPPPTSDPLPRSPEIRVRHPIKVEASLPVTAMSFAKFSQSGQNLFDHRIHPTTSVDQIHRKPKIISQENTLPSSFIPASKRPEMPTTRSRIVMSLAKSLPTVDPTLPQSTPQTILNSKTIPDDSPSFAPIATTPGSAFPTIMLRTGQGVRVTERPPSFDEMLSDLTSTRPRGSTPETIAKLRQQHRKVKLASSFQAVPNRSASSTTSRGREPKARITPSFQAVPNTSASSTTSRGREPKVKISASFPAVPNTSAPSTTIRGREPRVLAVAAVTTAQTTTSGAQKISTSSSSPTTSLFSHLRERPTPKQKTTTSSGTTRSVVELRSRVPKVKARQSLLRAITERLR